MTPSNRRTTPPAPAPPLPSQATAGQGTKAPSPRRPPSPILAGLRVLAGALLVGATSIGVAWTLHNHVMNSARFAIVAVEVSGSDHRGSAAIVAESGLLLGTNVFAADLDAARERILGDPWILEATLVRRLPGTIAIRVSERKAAALVVLGATFLATAEGEPFKPIEPDDPLELPLVTGLTPEALADDHEGTVRTVRRAIDLAAEYARSEVSRRSPLEEVHVAPDGTFTLVVGRSALELVLGGPPFRRKLDQAARVVAELDRRGAKADVIMLDNDARPERVVVRMR